MAQVALRKHHARQASERLQAGASWEDHDLVFTTSLGRAVEPRNFLRLWHDLCEKACLPRRPLHHARHTAASLMLSEGVPLKTVQETVGHSTIRLTADLYGHLMPGDADRAAQAMDRALGA
jgi:integrase